MRQHLNHINELFSCVHKLCFIVFFNCGSNSLYFELVESELKSNTSKPISSIVDTAYMTRMMGQPILIKFEIDTVVIIVVDVYEFSQCSTNINDGEGMDCSYTNAREFNFSNINIIDGNFFPR